jgi:hypothetical protein
VSGAASDDRVREDLVQADNNIAALRAAASRKLAAKAIAIAVLHAVEPVAIVTIEAAVASVAGPLGPAVGAILHTEIDKALQALGLAGGGSPQPAKP